MKLLLVLNSILGGGQLVGLVLVHLAPGGLPQSVLCPQLEHLTLSLGSNPPGGSDRLEKVLVTRWILPVLLTGQQIPRLGSGFLPRALPGTQSLYTGTPPWLPGWAVLESC